METTFDLEKTLGYLLNRCTILIKNELTHRFKQAGYEVTPEEWVILNRLWEQDGMSQNELARTTVKDKTTIVRFLDQMSKKQLITRKNSSEDARVKRVFLTPSGRGLKNRLIPIVQELLADCSENIKPSQLSVTISVLSDIEQNLLQIESKAAH
jgi:MarR family transcriptional regulator, organic hydroperoxide resistance regulator